MEGKMLEVSATSNDRGVWGLPWTGWGILHCRDRNPVEWDLRCEHVLNPGGAIAWALSSLEYELIAYFVQIKWP